MNSGVEATVQGFWTAFKAMPQRERETIVEKLLSEKVFKEDLMDIVILQQRKDEPSRTLDKYLAGRKKG